MPASRTAAVRGFRLAEALALRAWALRLLGGEAAGAAPACSAGSWETFLLAERCAHPLARAVAHAGVRLPPHAAEALHRRAEVELMRILSAAAQIHTVRTVAAAEGWRVVVMKGGVLVPDPARALDVADLDLLLRPGEGRALAARLEQGLGYVALHPDPDPRAGMQHLGQRVTPHHVQVEIHERLGGLDAADALVDRAQPLEGVPGVFRLHPRDHLRHLLEHVVQSHPDRRGNLRDLLLVATAAAAGPELPPELTASGHGGARAMRGTLEMGRALAGGRAPRDAFAAEAAARYLMLRHLSAWTGSGKFTRDLGGALVTLVAHPREYASLWGLTLRRPLGAASSYRSLPLRLAAQVAAPPLRAARLLAASLAAVPFAAWARSAASPRGPRQAAD
ncbi:MAG TPA: nucleotidyltransferase family protein [Longimicrobium sp.]|nr:nucleotidyltransferase family protein [Longimicrobium sp.]